MASNTHDVTLPDGSIVHGVPNGIPDTSVRAQYAAHVSALVKSGQIILGDRTLPDGTLVHGVPSNLTDSQVMAKIQESKAARASARKPAPAMQSWGQVLRDIPLKTAAGFGDMFLNTPTNVANLGIAAYGTAQGLAGHPERMPEPLKTPDLLQGALGHSGLIATGQQTPAQATTQRYGEAALSALALSPEASVGGLSRSAALGVGSQAGSDIASAAVPDTYPVAKGLAGALGGLAAPGAAGAAARKLGGLAISPSARVGKVLDTTLTPETKQQVLDYQPGVHEPFQPTLAQAVPSNETAEMERWARRQNGSVMFQQLDASNREAMQSTLDKAVQGREDASTVAEHVSDILRRDQSTRDQGQAFHDEAVTQAQNAVQTAQDALDSRMAPSGQGAEALGTQVQQDVHAARTAAKAELDKTTAPLRQVAYKAAPAVDLGPLMEQLDSAIKKAGMDHVVSGTLTSLRNHIAQNTETSPGEYYTDMEKADSLRADIKNRMAGRSDDSSQQYAKKELNGIMQSLNEHMNDASGGAWNHYLKSYASEAKRLMGPFEHAHVAPTIERDTYNQGFTSTPAQTANQVLRPGPEGAEVIRNLAKAGANTPAARDALQAHVADRIQSFRDMKTGSLSLSRLKGFLDSYKPALKEAGLYDRLNTDAKAIQFARDHLVSTEKEAKQYSAAAIKEANKDDLSDLGKLVKADQPQRIIQNMLDKPDGTRRIAKLADLASNNPGALNGLRRSVMTALVPLDRPGTEASMTDALKRFDAKQGALKQMGLYNDEQLGDIRSVLEQLNRESLSKAGGRRSPGFSGQADNMLNVMGSAVADRASKVALAGVVSASHVLGAAGGALLSYAAEEQLSGVFKARAKAKLAEAAYDPEVAQMLLRSRTKAREQASGALVKTLSQQIAVQAGVQGVAATRSQP